MAGEEGDGNDGFVAVIEEVAAVVEGVVAVVDGVVAAGMAVNGT